MPKDEWGVKRLCPHCTTRFYDLQNNPMTCPSCGASFDLASLLAGKTKPAASKPQDSQKAVANDADNDDDDDLLDDDDDGDVDLDDDLLDDDDDDTVSIDEIADVSKDDDD